MENGSTLGADDATRVAAQSLRAKNSRTRSSNPVPAAKIPPCPPGLSMTMDSPPANSTNSIADQGVTT